MGVDVDLVTDFEFHPVSKIRTRRSDSQRVGVVTKRGWFMVNHSSWLWAEGRELIEGKQRNRFPFNRCWMMRVDVFKSRDRAASAPSRADAPSETAASTNA
jgi:hypothetical protein